MCHPAGLAAPRVHIARRSGRSLAAGLERSGRCEKEMEPRSSHPSSGQSSEPLLELAASASRAAAPASWWRYSNGSRQKVPPSPTAPTTPTATTQAMVELPPMAPPPTRMMANRPLLARGLLATHKATAATTATTKVDRPAAMRRGGMAPERCGRVRRTDHASPPARRGSRRLRSTWQASHGRHGNPVRPPPLGSGAAQGRWAGKQPPHRSPLAQALEAAAALEIAAEPQPLARSSRRGARRICTA